MAAVAVVGVRALRGTPWRRCSVGEPGDRGGRSLAAWRAILAAMAAFLAMVALWAVTWFVTQDSSALVYNAEILSRSFDADSPFARTFSIRWQPIPNWVSVSVNTTSSA